MSARQASLERLEQALFTVMIDVGEASASQLASILADWIVGPGRARTRSALAAVDAVLGFECPACGATPGSRCRRPASDDIRDEFGAVYETCASHAPRVALADRPMLTTPPKGATVEQATSVLADLMLRQLDSEGLPPIGSIARVAMLEPLVTIRETGRWHGDRS